MGKTAPRKLWILIDNDQGFPYRLIKDESNFVPQRMTGTGKNGEPMYQNIGYFSKYGSALRRLAETVREDKVGWEKADRLDDLARIVENNHNVIKDIINDLNDRYENSR